MAKFSKFRYIIIVAFSVKCREIQSQIANLFPLLPPRSRERVPGPYRAEITGRRTDGMTTYYSMAVQVLEVSKRILCAESTQENTKSRIDLMEKQSTRGRGDQR